MLIGRQCGATRSGHIVRAVRRRTVVLLILLLACGLLCSCNDNPQAVYDRTYKTLLHGDLKQAQDEAHGECQRFNSNLEWAWKFRTLEARAALQQGHYPVVLQILESAPLPSDHPELVIPILTLRGQAHAKTHDFSKAESSLNEATSFCETSASASCGDVLQARGLLATEQNQSASAERLFELSLDFARSHRDASAESHALVSLGYEALAEGRFDEAIDRSEAAYQLAKVLGTPRLQVITLYNIGWANYKLGDPEKALKLSEEAEKLASQVEDIRDKENILTNIGYIYMDRRRFDMADQSFQQALSVAQGLKAQEDIYNALRALARLSLQTGDLANASSYAQQALDIARQDKNHLDELYPMLVQGQIAARRGDTKAAETTFLQVERDKICPVFLRWEAEHSLARLYEDEQHGDAAYREYRTALATFEGARDDVRHEDSQISFLTNAAQIYDDYVHFLVVNKKTDEALRWADYSRARTLAEGLGYLPREGAVGPPPLDARLVAQRAGGIVLFYWLGEKQSYLWTITPEKTSLAELPPRGQIDAAIKRYREAIAGEDGDVLKLADADGIWLYRTLVGPGQALLRKDAKVLVIPDGSLNKLNFETLLVPETAADATASERKPAEVKSDEAQRAPAKLHYWIEDATITNASSLRLLDKGLAAKRTVDEKGDGRLLLIGNSVSPNDEFRTPPRAAEQMDDVAVGHFPAEARSVFSRGDATRAAYIGSHPEQYSYIHFVAHGVASQLSPLDSYVVLSKPVLSKPDQLKPAQSKLSTSQGATPNTAPAATDAEHEPFKLYAREIVDYSKNNPLRADLVTVSACKSADGQIYSGEGLVGLSWAFLRAGAHNVVAALWDVTDASTPQFMDIFYGELRQGASPDTALRTAKLSLLRNSKFHNPFYWAPFQLYTGS